MVMAIPQWTDLSRRTFADSFPVVQQGTCWLDTAKYSYWQSPSNLCKVFKRKSTVRSIPPSFNSAKDKEATVRVQVAIVLGKLVHGEDLEAIEEGVQSLADILRNMMQFDPSPDVRRAALPGVHTQLNKQTLPVLLSRVKDPDATVRCTVFRVLKSTPVPARSLSLEQRTLLVRCGLGDRTPAVKAEASKLLAKWVDGTQELEAFISLFDLSSDNIAEDALGAVLTERPELLNDIDLSTGEKRSGVVSTTDALTRHCRVLLGRNDPGKIAVRTRLRLALHRLHQSSRPLGPPPRSHPSRLQSPAPLQHVPQLGPGTRQRSPPSSGGREQ